MWLGICCRLADWVLGTTLSRPCRASPCVAMARQQTSAVGGRQHVWPIRGQPAHPGAAQPDPFRHYVSMIEARPDGQTQLGPAPSLSTSLPPLLPQAFLLLIPFSRLVIKTNGDKRLSASPGEWRFLIRRVFIPTMASVGAPNAR
jgi:hypothetical protein